eukprot:gene1842-2074_t
MSVPSDKNISVKEFEKLSKYKDLEIEIRKMWSLKACTVPVIVGALGMIKKGTEKHPDKIPGRLKTTTSATLDQNTTVKELDPEEANKYLGVAEGHGINHASMKEKVRKEYYRRIRLVLKTELNSENRIEALNILAVPVVQYSLNILNWKMDEIRQMGTKTRKLLTSNRMHHRKADVDHLYLPRRNGGRGIINLETAYKTSTIEAHKYERELEFVDKVDRNDEFPAAKQAKSSKLGANSCSMKQTTERWNQKSLQGKYPLRCQQADVDQTTTHQWLRSSGLKAEMEGFILAAQDKSLFTRNDQANILKNAANEKCRFCDTHKETTGHLTSGCPILALNEYKNRHDRVEQ